MSINYDDPIPALFKCVRVSLTGEITYGDHGEWNPETDGAILTRNEANSCVIVYFDPLKITSICVLIVCTILDEERRVEYLRFHSVRTRRDLRTVRRDDRYDFTHTMSLYAEELAVA